MENISFLLERFKKALFTHSVIRESLVRAIRDVAKVGISLDALQIKNQTAFLSVSPAVRNEIYMHKDKILAALKKDYPQSSLTDIR